MMMMVWIRNRTQEWGFFGTWSVHIPQDDDVHTRVHTHTYRTHTHTHTQHAPWYTSEEQCAALKPVTLPHTPLAMLRLLIINSLSLFSLRLSLYLLYSFSLSLLNLSILFSPCLFSCTHARISLSVLSFSNYSHTYTILW